MLKWLTIISFLVRVCWTSVCFSACLMKRGEGGGGRWGINHCGICHGDICVPRRSSRGPVHLCNLQLSAPPPLCPPCTLHVQQEEGGIREWAAEVKEQRKCGHKNRKMIKSELCAICWWRVWVSMVTGGVFLCVVCVNASLLLADRSGDVFKGPPSVYVS